jgi:hypothetical protein
VGAEDKGAEDRVSCWCLVWHGLSIAFHSNFDASWWFIMNAVSETLFHCIFTCFFLRITQPVTITGAILFATIHWFAEDLFTNKNWWFWWCYPNIFFGRALLFLLSIVVFVEVWSIICLMYFDLIKLSDGLFLLNCWLKTWEADLE